jgi:hypothetical protein
MRQAPPSTTARQRHGACHPKQRTPTTHTTHIAHSHAEYRHTSPARQHDVPHNRDNTALRKHHCTHTAARTPHTARRKTPRNPTHRPQKITPSNKRRLRATLTAELSGCPASTGCCRRVGCFPSSTPCRSHVQPSRHTMAPDAAADPSQSQRITQHQSNQVKASRHTACYHSRTVTGVSDSQTTQPDIPRERQCTSSPTCHRTAPQPLLRIATLSIQRRSYTRNYTARSTMLTSTVVR